MKDEDIWSIYTERKYRKIVLWGCPKCYSHFGQYATETYENGEGRLCTLRFIFCKKCKERDYAFDLPSRIVIPPDGYPFIVQMYGTIERSRKKFI